MLTGMSAGEFDQRWFALVDEFKLHEHGWVKQMYAKRHKWAKVFLKEHFLLVCEALTGVKVFVVISIIFCSTG